MKIKNIIHKGLRRFIEDDDASGLQPAVMPKVRKIVSFLQDMEREDELRTVAKLEGPSAYRVSDRHLEPLRDENWRVTFRIEQTRIEIIDLDYEDYH